MFSVKNSHPSRKHLPACALVTAARARFSVWSCGHFYRHVWYIRVGVLATAVRSEVDIRGAAPQDPDHFPVAKDLHVQRKDEQNHQMVDGDDHPVEGVAHVLAEEHVDHRGFDHLRAVIEFSVVIRLDVLPIRATHTSGSNYCHIRDGPPGSPYVEAGPISQRYTD